MNNSSVEIFAKRFRAEGDRILYREKLTAPGIAVSVEERDRFIAEFKRQSLIAKVVMYAGMIPVTGLIVLIVLRTADSSNPNIIGLLIAAIVGSYAAAYTAWSLWLLRAPARTLAARTAALPGYSKEEAERINLKQVTWTNLILGAFTIVGVIALQGVKHDLLVGWNRLWLLFGAAMLGFLGWRAWKKWCVERSGRSGRIVS